MKKNGSSSSSPTLHLVPLHKKSRNEQTGRCFPLSLGRRTLARWWWKTCWCRDTPDGYRCGNCKKVGKEVRSFSRQMMSISSNGLLRHAESNKNPGLLSVAPLRKFDMKGSIQLREGDILQFGKDCDEILMSFEVRPVPTAVTPCKDDGGNAKSRPPTIAPLFQPTAPKLAQPMLYEPRRPLYDKRRRRKRKIAFDSSSDEDGSSNSWLQTKKRNTTNSSLSSDSDDSTIRRTRRRQQQRQAEARTKAAASPSKTLLTCRSSQFSSASELSTDRKVPARKSLFRRRNELILQPKALSSGTGGGPPSEDDKIPQYKEPRLNTQSEVCSSRSSVLSMPECPTLPSNQEKRYGEEDPQAVPETEYNDFQFLEESNVGRASSLSCDDWKKLGASGDSLRQALASVIVKQRARRGDTTWLPSLVGNAKVRASGEPYL